MYGTMYAAVYCMHICATVTFKPCVAILAPGFYPRIRFSARTASDADTAGDSNINTPGDCK